MTSGGATIWTSKTSDLQAKNGKANARTATSIFKRKSKKPFIATPFLQKRLDQGSIVVDYIAHEPYKKERFSKSLDIGS
jgi:hypothetical protein